MHHARKVYRTADKKQRRQIIGRNVIPSLKMKTYRNKKALDAEGARLLSQPPHVHSDGPGGGPVETWANSAVLRFGGAREVRRRRAPAGKGQGRTSWSTGR